MIKKRDIWISNFTVFLACVLQTLSFLVSTFCKIYRFVKRIILSFFTTYCKILRVVLQGVKTVNLVKNGKFKFTVLFTILFTVFICQFFGALVHLSTDQWSAVVSTLTCEQFCDSCNHYVFCTALKNVFRSFVSMWEWWEQHIFVICFFKPQIFQKIPNTTQVSLFCFCFVTRQNIIYVFGTHIQIFTLMLCTK